MGSDSGVRRYWPLAVAYLILGFAAFALIAGCIVIGLGPEAHGVSFRKEPAGPSAG